MVSITRGQADIRRPLSLSAGRCYWDDVDGKQVTERRWVHDRGGVDWDLLRRRVFGVDALTEMLLRVGFVRVAIAGSGGAVGPARTMDEFVVAFR